MLSFIPFRTNSFIDYTLWVVGCQGVLVGGTDSRIDILYGLCHTIKSTQGTEVHTERD